MIARHPVSDPNPRSLPQGGQSASHWVSNTGPERLQLFEVADGRFPLPVGHLQGDRALGCDIASFRTASERDAFSTDTSLHATVDRFIEVKGRSSASGVIDLRGNELARAREFGPRYWIYRVFDMGDGSYDFVILPDPTAGHTREVLEINLFRSSAATGYAVEAIESDPQSSVEGGLPAPDPEPTVVEPLTACPATGILPTGDSGSGTPAPAISMEVLGITHESSVMTEEVP